MSQTNSSATPKPVKKSQAHRVPPYKRPLIVGGFAFILIVVVIVTILICKNLNAKKPENQPSTNSPDHSEVVPPDTTEPKPDDDLESKAPPYEGEDPNELPELTGVIVYQEVDPETAVLHSAVSINQYLQGEGQCVFNLIRDGATVRTTSALAEPDVTTSSCGPLSLSVEGLSGEYDIEVLLTGDGKRGTITGKITI